MNKEHAQLFWHQYVGEGKVCYYMLAHALSFWLLSCTKSRRFRLILMHFISVLVYLIRPRNKGAD
ncbi:unnamed protein product [Amoebophrya sp. A25]|nr:unnamed protein product [Amoebophrya sp. A25]|eukprot:GSA25T00017157001.1